MSARWVLAAALLAFAQAAQARDIVAIDVPAGTLGQSVTTLARQAGVSINVAHAPLWNRQVPALRGRMAVDRALARMIRGTGAVAMQVDARSWRIVQATPVRPRLNLASAPSLPESATAPIIVTASKRDTPLANYGGIATIIGGADMAFGGLQGMDAVLARLATLSSTHLGSGRNKLFIRGIADSSFTGPTQATVGQYLGDLRLTYNAPDPDLRLYDIASVEVLEGPQGTLYGAGSLGGIVRIMPNVPDLDRLKGAVAGGVSATEHGDPGGDMGAMVNMPLIDGRMAVRVVGYGVSEGGYIDDILRDRRDINRNRIVGGRATVRVDLGDDWNVDISGVAQNNDGRDNQYADRSLPPLTRASRADGGFDADYRQGSLTVQKLGDDLHFQASAAIVGQQIEERYDASPAEGPERLFRQENDTGLFVGEVRVAQPTRDGFGWVAGGSYVRNRTTLSRSLGAPDMLVPLTGVTNRVREATLYGEASLSPIEGLTITAGARYSHATLSGEGEDVPLALATANRGITAGRKERKFLPSAGMSAMVLPRTMLFVRYQQGFRPGGLAIEGPFVRRFRNDRVSTLETGLRHTPSGPTGISLTTSIAHSRWTNIQADFIDDAGLPSTENIGDGRIWSASGAAEWRPARALTFDVSFAFNDGRIVDPSAALVRAAVAYASAIDRVERIPNVARITARTGIDYQAKVGGDLDLRVNAWARYIGKSRVGIGPVLGEAQGDYLDTAATVRIGRPTIGVTLGITNLADSIGNRFALGTPFAAGQGNYITPMRPRTIRLGIDATF